MFLVLAVTPFPVFVLSEAYTFKDKSFAKIGLCFTVLQFIHVFCTQRKSVLGDNEYVWRCSMCGMNALLITYRVCLCLPEHTSNYYIHLFFWSISTFSLSHQLSFVYFVSVPHLILNNFLPVVHWELDTTREVMFPSLLVLFLPCRLYLPPPLSPLCNKIFSH